MFKDRSSAARIVQWLVSQATQQATATATPGGPSVTRAEGWRVLTRPTMESSATGSS